MSVVQKLRAVFRKKADSTRTIEETLRAQRDSLVLRIDRLEALHGLRIVPLLSNFLGGHVVWWALGGPGRLDVTLWLIAMLAVLCIDLASGHAILRKRPDFADAARDQRRAILVCMAYGAVWGALMTFFFVSAGPDERHLIAVVLTAYLASSALVLAAVPGAVIGFATPIVLQAVPVLVIDGVQRNAFLLMMIGIYLVSYPLTLGQYWRSLAERSRAMSEVDEQKHLISVLLDDFETNSDDWLWQADAQLHIQRISEAFTRQSGLSPEQVAGMRIEDFISASLTLDGRPDPGARQALDRMHARESFRDLAIRMMVDDEERWWSVSGTPVFGRDGVFAGYRGIGRDITQKRRAERELTFLAHHDPLTGGANRASYNRQLDLLGHAVLRERRRFALIQFDLDDFKAVNDTAGHAVGDDVLAAAFARIRRHLPPEAFLARIGGDEFAAILEIDPDTNAAELNAMVHETVTAVARPYEAASGVFRIGASAGIAIMPDDGTDVRVVMQLADIALYNAKSDDAHRVHLASAAEGAAYAYRKGLERDLRTAVERNEFCLYFQPIVEAASGRTMVVEALLRWRHPRLGFVSPAEFIPIAEQNGAIQQIGRWVLMEACRQAASWPRDIRVSVNISPRQLDRDDLGTTVLEAVKAGGIAPSRLEIEITESAFLSGVERVRSTVRRLQAYGVTVAMDDFGTGYSSLSSLQDVPFNKLKIDRSLVVRDRRERRAVSILKSIVAIGQALELHVTAEGVETAEQAAFLKGLGVQSLQGYLFAKPMPAAELCAFFAGEREQDPGAPALPAGTRAA